MITLPDRCEFLSDAWLDEARKFLEREFKNRKERLAKSTFSVSERFTHAPPHLKFADDVGTWGMRYDGESVSVSRDFNESADLVVEGDYQAALTAAQFVGVLAPGAMVAMAREVVTMFGKDAIHVKGALKDEQAGEILALLHDHMGRRTVENPDLAHRAARQGLSAKIREMEEQGYTVLERAISPEFADEVRSATLRALLPHQTFSMNWMLYHGREFEQLIQNPLMMTLVDSSLGRGAVIASFSCIRKGPGPGVIPVHTDYAHVPEPYPEFSMTGVGVWARGLARGIRSHLDRAAQPQAAPSAATWRGPRGRRTHRDAEGLGRLLHAWRVALAGRSHGVRGPRDAARAFQPRNPAEPGAQEDRCADAAPEFAAAGRDAGRGRLVRQDVRRRARSCAVQLHATTSRFHRKAEAGDSGWRGLSETRRLG
jgi:hypothetical protein